MCCMLSNFSLCLHTPRYAQLEIQMCTIVPSYRYATGGVLGTRPLLHFTLRLRTGLLIEAQHILHLRLRPCIVSSFQLPIYLRPTLKITHLRPNSHQYYWSLIGIYYDGTMHGKHFATGWEEIFLMG